MVPLTFEFDCSSRKCSTSRSPVTVPLITASPQRTLPSMWPLSDSTSSARVLPSSAERAIRLPLTRPSTRMPVAKLTSPTICTSSAIRLESLVTSMNGRFLRLADHMGTALLMFAVTCLAEEGQLFLAFAQPLVQRIDLALELLAAPVGHALHQARLLQPLAQLLQVFQRLGLLLQRAEPLAPIEMARRSTGAQRRDDEQAPAEPAAAGATGRQHEAGARKIRHPGPGLTGRRDSGAGRWLRRCAAPRSAGARRSSGRWSRRRRSCRPASRRCRP